MNSAFVIISKDSDLQHHGILGQKWGVRRYQNLDGTRTDAGKRREAKDQFREAKEKHKTTVKNARKNAGLGIGIDGIKKYRNAENTIQKANNDLIKAKADYAKSRKGEKGEFNTYVKEMRKSGVAGSALDRQNGGRSERLYKSLVREKGKDYADRVQKKVQNKAVTQFAVGMTVAAGSYAVAAILERKYK